MMLASKDSRCYVCGPDNPLGLQVRFRQDGAQGSVARYLARPEHGGWNGIIHGGVIFALMDEALGWALYYQKLPAVTARVETKFRKPMPVGAQVVVKAWVVQQRKRLFDVHAEIRMEDAENTLLAESEGTMCRIEPADAGSTVITSVCQQSQHSSHNPQRSKAECAGL
jgi:uncharacterized protein (TIGR00369 family)